MRRIRKHEASALGMSIMMLGIIIFLLAQAPSQVIWGIIGVIAFLGFFLVLLPKIIYYVWNKWVATES